MRKIYIPMLAITPHGGNRILLTLSSYLCQNGFEVTILSTNYNETKFELDSRVKLKKIGGRIKNKKIRFLFFLLVSPFYMKDSLIISNHFLTFFPAFICGVFFNCKHLSFIQGIEGECMGNRKWIFEKLNYLTLKYGNNVVANPFLSERVSKYGNVLFDFNLGVSKFFLNENNFFDDKKYDVIYFLREEKNKGLDRFFDIISDNKDLNFLCVSQSRELLIEVSTRFDNIVTFCPSSDLELYGKIDLSKVLLLTSYNEGFALPPLEAMFRGVPFIYFECGGPSVYASSNNSVLIENCSDFRMAYSKIINEYNYYSKSSLITAKNFFIEKSLSNFTQFISRFI